MRPPKPLWKTGPPFFFHLVGVLVLPFAVAFSLALFVEAGEIAETWPSLAVLSTWLLLPVLAAQVLGVLVKSHQDLKWWAMRDALDLSRTTEILAHHMRILTPRGWLVLGVALLALALTLLLQWAQLALLAVLSLGLFYVLVAWSLAASAALMVQGDGPAADQVATRHVHPAVVSVGMPVRTSFRFRRLPLPWGYRLLIEDALPPRLESIHRHTVGPSIRRSAVEVRGELATTRRGMYRLGPAQLWYQDMLGLTRITVATSATASLTVLPAFRPVRLPELPASTHAAPSLRIEPSRFPTDDHFRLEEYLAGDDTRRIHWRLSLRTGKLHVRRPESRESQAPRIVLVLDTHLPRDGPIEAAAPLERLLDGMVEAWLGTALALLNEGHRVSLAAAVQPVESGACRLETLSCRRGNALAWQELGARVAWQADVPLADVLEALSGDRPLVVTSAGFATPPPAQAVSWLVPHPAWPLEPPEPDPLQALTGDRHLLDWLLRRPDDEPGQDGLHHRWARSWRSLRQRRSRLRLRRRIAHGLQAHCTRLHTQSAPVFRIAPHGLGYRLKKLHHDAEAEP